MMPTLSSLVALAVPPVMTSWHHDDSQFPVCTAAYFPLFSTDVQTAAAHFPLYVTDVQTASFAPSGCCGVASPRYHPSLPLLWQSWNGSSQIWRLLQVRFNNENIDSHCSEVFWVSWHLKLVANWLFVQNLVQTECQRYWSELTKRSTTSRLRMTYQVPIVNIDPGVTAIHLLSL